MKMQAFGRRVNLRGNNWKMHVLMAMLLIFSEALPAQAEQGANEIRAARSVAEWSEYVQAVGKQDSKPWIAEVNHETDSLLRVFSDLTTQLSKEDWEAFLASRKSGLLEYATAVRIFGSEEIGSIVGAIADSVNVIWEFTEGEKEANGIDMVLLNPDEMSWESRVYYFQNGCYLGAQNVYHKYGIRGGKFADTKGVSGAFHLVNQGSGTGIWQHSWLFYTAVNGHLVPAGALLEEVNLANPCVYNRQLESKIVSYNPLTVRYEWTIELGYRYRGNQPTFKGKADVVYTANLETGVMEPQFKSSNLNTEKLLAFDLGASKKLFLHAWNKELLTILKGKDSIKRKAVIEYLEDEYSE